jgi:hypothetical protein
MTRTPRGGINKPQWELYDIRYNPEHSLAESLIMEYTDIVGIKVTYHIRSNDVTYDTLYGEHTGTTYEDGKATKLIYNVDEEPNLWSSFGMFGGDILITHIPQGTWKRDISATIEPKIGDVVTIDWYSPFVGEGRTFEVAHVDDDDKTFQLKKMVYILVLRPYRFSEQSTSAEALAMASAPISAYGDNEWIEEQSDAIDDYDDVDTKIYGY